VRLRLRRSPAPRPPGASRGQEQEGAKLEADDRRSWRDERRAARLAKEKGVELPASADLVSQAKGAVVGALPGKTFDSQYVSSQLDNHQEAFALFEKEAQSGDHPDVKALAEKGISVIQRHITELQKLSVMPEIR
jgi:predicted outer membrane protein